MTLVCQTRSTSKANDDTAGPLRRAPWGRPRRSSEWGRIGAAGALALCLPLLAAAAAAQPSGAVVGLYFDDDGDRKVVAAVSDRGVVFIGDDFATYRAYASQALTGRPWFWHTDADNNRGDEYIFAGNPSFVLAPGGTPLFGVLQGCDDFYTGNMFQDGAYEVFCRNGSTLTVWNYDGQFLWEYTVEGMRLSSCLADDVDGDEKLEFGCQAGDAWILVDIERDEPVQDVPDNPAADAVLEDPAAEWVRNAQAILRGERTLDLNGDRNDGDTLRFADGTLTMLAADGTSLGSVSLPESELYSVEVADLNGDRTPEIFLGGAGTVYVVSPSGELLATVNANPNDLERDAQVTVESATAHGLSDSSSEATRAAIEGGVEAAHRCYHRHIGTDPFIRVGNMFYELSVDDRGRVASRQRIHSSVGNRELEECVEGVLDDLRFSPATEGAGTVSLRLGFDFVDR